MSGGSGRSVTSGTGHCGVGASVRVNTGRASVRRGGVGVGGVGELLGVRAKARGAVVVIVVPLGDGDGEGDEVGNAASQLLSSVHLLRRIADRVQTGIGIGKRTRTYNSMRMRATQNAARPRLVGP